MLSSLHLATLGPSILTGQGDFLPYAYRLHIALPSASLLCQYLLLGKDLFSIIYTSKGI